MENSTNNSADIIGFVSAMHETIRKYVEENDHKEQRIQIIRDHFQLQRDKFKKIALSAGTLAFPLLHTTIGDVISVIECKALEPSQFIFYDPSFEFGV